MSCDIYTVIRFHVYFSQNSKFKFAFSGIQVCIERIKFAFRGIKLTFRRIKFAFSGIKFACVLWDQVCIERIKIA